MFKKSTFLVILVLTIVHISLVAKEKTTTKTPITNSIYFGGEYFYSVFPKNGGGYIGVETNFGNFYISLLNHIGIGYMRVEEIFKPHDKYNALGLYYSTGIRVYLGIRYVFMDFNAGVSNYIPLSHKNNNSLYFFGTILLGFNIPLSKGIDLQLSGGGGIIPVFIGWQFRAGLQFKL